MRFLKDDIFDIKLQSTFQKARLIEGYMGPFNYMLPLYDTT